MADLSAPIDATGQSSIRAYWTAWAATLIFFGGFYTLIVPLPRYLAEVGLADWQIGLVLGAFGVASLIGRPLAGLSADRWGMRPVLLVGAAALLAGAVAVPLTTDTFALFGLRVLQAIGYVAFTTAGTAMVIALSPPAERGQRLAIFGAAANVAITLTPLVVGMLLTWVSLPTAFWIAGGLALSAGLLALSLGSLRPAEAAPTGWAALRIPRLLWIPMLAAGLLGAGFGAFFQFAPILAERRAVIPAGTLYAIYGSGIIATRIFGGRVIDRLGIGRIIPIAAGLLAIGLGLAAVGQTALFLALASLLIAAGSGLFHPTLLAHHAALLPTAPGRASAAFYIGFDLGLGLGSWILGGALELGGLVGLYGAAALIVILAIPLAPLLARQHLVA